MKTTFQKIILLAVFSGAMAYAQKPMQKPDYEAIKKEVADNGSEFYYPKLKKRLIEKDTTLTASDFTHLYYGFVYQKEYSPYSRNPNEDKLQDYYKKDNLSQKERDKFIDLASQSLKAEIFDLRVMNFLAYIYHLNGDEPMARKTSFILQKLVDTIFSTGDGLTCETGFHVISVSHEYVVLHMLELEPTGQSLIDNCDYLSFEKGKYKVDGLYFEISRMLEAEMQALGK